MLNAQEKDDRYKGYSANDSSCSTTRSKVDCPARDCLTAWLGDIMCVGSKRAPRKVGLGAGQTQEAEFFGPDCSMLHCPSGDDPGEQQREELACEHVGRLLPPTHSAAGSGLYETEKHAPLFIWSFVPTPYLFQRVLLACPICVLQKRTKTRLIARTSWARVGRG